MATRLTLDQKSLGSNPSGAAKNISPPNISPHQANSTAAKAALISSCASILSTPDRFRKNEVTNLQFQWWGLLTSNHDVHPERSRDVILRRAPLAQDEPSRRSRRAKGNFPSKDPTTAIPFVLTLFPITATFSQLNARSGTNG